jgi:hypothetical protein
MYILTYNNTKTCPLLNIAYDGGCIRVREIFLVYFPYFENETYEIALLPVWVYVCVCSSVCVSSENFKLLSLKDHLGVCLSVYRP